MEQIEKKTCKYKGLRLSRISTVNCSTLLELPGVKTPADIAHGSNHASPPRQVTGWGFPRIYTTFSCTPSQSLSNGTLVPLSISDTLPFDRLWVGEHLNVVFPSRIRDCQIMSWGHAQARHCGRRLASKSFGFRGKTHPVTCRGEGLA
jgi:hypothetical protein